MAIICIVVRPTPRQSVATRLLPLLEKVYDPWSFGYNDKMAVCGASHNTDESFCESNLFPYSAKCVRGSLEIGFPRMLIPWDLLNESLLLVNPPVRTQPFGGNENPPTELAQSALHGRINLAPVAQPNRYSISCPPTAARRVNLLIIHINYQT